MSPMVQDEKGHDLSYHFDADLRDVPNAPVEMRQETERMKAELSSDSISAYERLRLLGHLGVYLRMLGDLQSAEEWLTEAIALSEEVDRRMSALANRLRLAHVYQWQRRFDLSDALFKQAVAVCSGTPEFADYLDFACQHFGKSLFDQGRYREAEGLFKKALHIREAKGDKDLIESSRLSLDVTRARIEGERRLK